MLSDLQILFRFVHCPNNVLYRKGKFIHRVLLLCFFFNLKQFLSFFFCFIMLTFLKSRGQSFQQKTSQFNQFVSCSLMIRIRLHYIAGILQKRCCVFSVHYIRRHGALICFIIGDINFHHLIVLTRFFLCKVTIFSNANILQSSNFHLLILAFTDGSQLALIILL